jgi:tripartite-type tricarboxylate transporter receptor subunit TctC
MTRITLGLAVALLLGLPALDATAADDFFAGKTVTVIAADDVGGGFDISARLIARHLGRHVPGNPTFVVKTMAGATGQAAMQYLSDIAVKDGTTIVTFNPGLLLSSVLDPNSVKANVKDLAYIGSIAANVRVCYAWHTTGIKTLEDMRKKDQIFLGQTGTGGGTADIDQKILGRLLGVKIKQIPGYSSGSAARLGLERGELQAGCSGSSSIPQSWLDNKQVNVVVRLQPDFPPQLSKDIPYAGDLLKDANQKLLLDLLSIPSILGRPFVVARGVPAARVKTLTDAFAETVKDSQFVADSDKLKQEISEIPGAKLQGMVDSMAKVPQSVIDEAVKVMAN